jgi:penicillin-insensitive murein endopeptidase
MSGSGTRLLRAIACGLCVGLVPATAAAAPHHGHDAVDGAHASARAKSHRSGKKGGQSIGAPNNGHLAGAVRLRGSKVLRQREGAHSWGLSQLVHLLQRSATAVARKHRGSQMLVGDLSGRTGGHLDRHNSHQTGRDADVGFYVMSSKGKPMAVKRFIPFDDAGNARDAPGVRFDEARNWAMVEAMLKDDKATVRYLFITNALRGKLLAHAAKKHAPKDLVERAAAAMMSPSDADLHDDHVHVRIACPESTRDTCVEEATVHDAVAMGETPKPPAQPVAKAADEEKPAEAPAEAAPPPAAAPAPSAPAPSVEAKGAARAEASRSAN